MSSKTKISYGPNERDYLEQNAKIIKSYSKHDYTKLPDPVRDPIVSNNISNAEFDYTYNEGKDIKE
ncbi:MULTISPECIES: hypothetical protein [Clostridium]|uniref:hypothetical protein n=1 Tax=Clostridium TaxID=1485 RepID=UPI00069FD8CA|nr:MULTISPECIES: hypothetical protein [Clostridium]KOF57170.1 hypothetical protein AGR56_11850 [Clostridium sp. DMHC 10]MCD2348073.1 hypothetical protein [Clostridium guangxiense]